MSDKLLLHNWSTFRAKGSNILLHWPKMMSSGSSSLSTDYPRLYILSAQATQIFSYLPKAKTVSELGSNANAAGSLCCLLAFVGVLTRVCSALRNRTVWIASQKHTATLLGPILNSEPNSNLRERLSSLLLLCQWGLALRSHFLALCQQLSWRFQIEKKGNANIGLLV